MGGKGACFLKVGAILCLLLLLCACAAPQPPRWRSEALSVLKGAAAVKADRLLPSEYRSVREVFFTGEELLMEGEKERAERVFLMALQKGELLNKNAALEQARLAREEAARRAEEDRIAEEKRKEAEEAARVAAEQAAAAAPKPVPENGQKKVKPKEPRLVSSYTVRSGESLPLIAAHPEVYSDRNLWPLLYRANRDQIADPRHIWPGQRLKVPRSASRDDLSEARRYAQDKPLR